MTKRAFFQPRLLSSCALCVAAAMLLPGATAMAERQQAPESGSRNPTTASVARQNVESLIAEIVQDTYQTRHYTGINALNEQVLASIRDTPRDKFVPPTSAVYAWENRPLSIGYGQTISQPFIVALMTQLLEPDATMRVLEIGTGSGYQAAVLSSLVNEVYSIEIVPELARQAAAVLGGLGYDNVSVRAGDGWHGWPEAAPFDAVIVTAVAQTIPPRLIEQLKPGGRIVIPLGPAHGAQQLVVGTKTGSGIETRNVLPVQFVPFTRADDTRADDEEAQNSSEP